MPEIGSRPVSSALPARLLHEPAWTALAGIPGDPGEKLGRWDPKSAGELGERVDTGHSHTSLQQADLSPVKGGAEGKFLLAELGGLADAQEVLSEAGGDAVVSHLSHPPNRRSKQIAAWVGTTRPPER